MANVSCEFKQLGNNLTVTLGGLYHRGHGAAVQQELGGVNGLALLHNLNQVGVVLEEHRGKLVHSSPG